MTYSLVSAASLGFDLVRLPCGHQVAEVLLTGLRATRFELRQLADAHPGPARRARWQEVRCAQPRDGAREAIRLAGPALTLAVDGDNAASTAVLRRLERAPLGDVDSLERLIRSDVLDWTWTGVGELAVESAVATQAADVLVDAAASAYAADWLPAPLRRQLVGPYLAATRRGGHHIPDPAVGALLRRFAAVSSSEREAWRRAADEQRVHTTAWAPAMHQAAWAAHLSGRLRPVAMSQLEAVRAFHQAGFTDRDGSYGVWNAICGVVQAYVVRDMLADADFATLLRPWLRVHETQPNPFE